LIVKNILTVLTTIALFILLGDNMYDVSRHDPWLKNIQYIGLIRLLLKPRKLYSELYFEK